MLQKVFYRPIYLITPVYKWNDVTSGTRDVFACSNVIQFWELPLWLSLTWCARSCEQMQVKVKVPAVRLIELTNYFTLAKAERETDLQF